MENSSSDVSTTSLHDFFERMKQPSAADFVKAIKSFVVSFSNNSPNPERDSAAIQQFFTNMEVAFRAHPLWAGCSEEELETAAEGLEKYVMTKLFTRVFASLPDDVKLDTQLHEKMALIQQFIRPENLDIKPNFQNEASWLLAQKELQKINMYKAPRDKLVCILNCCKVINNLLLHASISSDENVPGADEFLPVLIYVTLKANPPQLHSNLLFIQRFRRQSRLVAEPAYYFTNMLSAESFITNIDAQSLSMDESEFEMNMESARALLSGLSGVAGTLSNQTYHNVASDSSSEPTEAKREVDSAKEKDQAIRPQLSELNSGNMEVSYAKNELMSKIPSMSDLENKGANLLLKEDQVNRVFQEYPYLFAQVGDLTLQDVEDLLNNYKQLVFKYACLSKGFGVSTSPPFSSISQIRTQDHDETGTIFEDNKEKDVNDDSGKEVENNNDGSEEVLVLAVENLDLKMVQDEAVAPRGGENSESSPS